MTEIRVRIRVRSSPVEVEVEYLDADRGGLTGVRAGSPTAESSPAEDEHEGAGVDYVRAPLLGTFYHAPEPGARPFVRAGDVVEAGQQVGIVEAMKLMNPIEAARLCRIVELLVADATPVEYDQRLVAVFPLDGS
jgi:acetyl-CoA carboxylase biotin carboxyl carrier protein